MFSHIENRELESASQDKECFEWTFAIAGGVMLRVSAPWRVVSSGKIRLGWEDNEQAFGLPTPLDAQLRLQELVIGKTIESATTNSHGDLTLHFDGKVALEIFNASCGYEGWTLNGPDNRWVVAQGGGRIVEAPGDA